mgnify:FL=1
MVIKMKILIMSDIHGNYKSLNNVLKNESFDKLIILGDLFSYGFNYNKDENNILKLLSNYKDAIILIRGNCDENINYEEFGLFAHDVISLHLNNHVVTLTHGNIYSKGFLPSYHGDIFVSGHTHVPMLLKEQGIIYLNPGSIGKPRGGLDKSYAIFEDNKIEIKTIEGKIIKEMKIN